MDLPAAMEKYWGQVTAFALGVFTVAKWIADQRAKRRQEAAAEVAARAAAKIDLTRLAQEVSAEAIQTLRDELHRQALEIETLRREIHDMQREHIASLADKDAEIALLRGRNRQLEANVAAHRRLMIAAGMTLPPEPAFFEVDHGGELKSMGEIR